MLRTIEQSKNVDAEAVLLARVYRLILSWGDDDKTDETRARDERETKVSKDDEK